MAVSAETPYSTGFQGPQSDGMSTTRGSQDDVTNTVRGNISGSTVILGRDMHVVHHAAHEVDWPIRIGAIPEEAAHFQHRAIADQLEEALNNFGTVVLRQVLSGTGGVGKTQLAAHHARALARITDPDKRVDLLIWVNASTRDQIIFAYAQAARNLFAVIPDDPEQAAQVFLTWLQAPHKHRDRRWLIVWDDLAAHTQVSDLWPPHDQPHGRVLVTTRRRDHTLTTQRRHLIDVGVYTPEEAHAFLTNALDEAGIPHAPTELESLAHDLGHLPLALGQAVTYMAELGLGCAAYLDLFHDRMHTLTEVFPDWDTLTPLAATWDLSLEQANIFHPQGIARPMMGLIALLDGTGIPEQVLTSPPVLEFLSAHRIMPTEPASVMEALSPKQARAALASLTRLSLTTRTAQQVVSGLFLVGSHQLTQRATRENITTRPTRTSVSALAEALVRVWPRTERNTPLEQHLQNNTSTLRSHSTKEDENIEDWLWESTGIALLIHAGKSLQDCGRAQEAVAHWEQMYEYSKKKQGVNQKIKLTIHHELIKSREQNGDHRGAVSEYQSLIKDIHQTYGPDSHEALQAEGNLTYSLSKFEDPSDSANAYKKLLKNQIRALGPDHPDTLTTRSNIAFMRNESGDIDGSIEEYELLLQDQSRILGGHHEDTLRTRHHLAELKHENGSSPDNVEDLEILVKDQCRTLGPDHPGVLRTRHSMAEWIGRFGDAEGAVAAYKEILADRLRLFGASHPETLNTRHNIAAWLSKAEKHKEALRMLECLLEDEIKFLGPNHVNIFTTRLTIAATKFTLGDEIEAIKLVSTTFRNQKRELGPDHPQTKYSAEFLKNLREQITGRVISPGDL